jgi:hypothetical protein
MLRLAGDYIVTGQAYVDVAHPTRIPDRVATEYAIIPDCESMVATRMSVKGLIELMITG